jgi:hypothetical protein
MIIEQSDYPIVASKKLLICEREPSGSPLRFMLRRSSLVECGSVLHGTCLQCIKFFFSHQYVQPCLSKNPKYTFYTIKSSLMLHSTNEDLLNIKRKGDPEVLYPLSYVRYHWNPEPVCNKSHFVSLFYLSMCNILSTSIYQDTKISFLLVYGCG